LLRKRIPLIRLEVLPDFDVRESLGSNRVTPQGLAAGTRMKKLIRWMWPPFVTWSGHARAT